MEAVAGGGNAAAFFLLVALELGFLAKDGLADTIGSFKLWLVSLLPFPETGLKA
jgi:hypothetical protein